MLNKIRWGTVFLLREFCHELQCGQISSSLYFALKLASMSSDELKIFEVICITSRLVLLHC